MRNIFTLYSLRIAFIVGTLLSAHYCHAQSALKDTAQAEILVKKAMEFHLQVEYDSSIIYLQNAAKIFQGVENWERYVHCLNIIGDCLSRTTALDSMQTVLHQARDIEEKRLKPDNLECALSYSLLGLLNISQDKFDMAIENILKGKKIREHKLGKDHKYVAASNYLLGIANMQKENYGQALEAFNDALRVYNFQNDSDEFNRAITLSGIGLVFFLRSDFDIALRYFARADSLTDDGERKYASVTADCENHIGRVYLEKGESNQAILHLTKAIDLYRNIFGHNCFSLTNCYSGLGAAYEAEGDYDKAIEFYKKVITLDKKFIGDNHPFLAYPTRWLGSAYANKNDLDNALRYSEKALTIHRKAIGNNHPELAYTLEILGNVYKKRREYSASLENFQKALALRLRLKESTDRNDIANLYSEIGSVYSEMKDFDRALKYYHKALLLHNKLPEPNRPQRAATLKGIGDTYSKLQKFYTALIYYQQSLNTLCSNFLDTSVYANPTGDNITNNKDLIEVLKAKAAALEKCYLHESHALSDLQAALTTYESAANVLNMLRKKISTEGSKLFLEEESYSFHQNAIRISMKLFDATRERRYQESAFYFAENSKANVLLDGLHDSEAKQFSGIPDSILEKERTLRIDLTYYENQLQRENDKKEKRDSAKIIALQDQCFALNNNMQRLLTLLENEYPQYYELKYKTHSATIGEVQNAIDERTCIIDYSLGEHFIAIFSITKSTFDIVAVPKPANFDHLVSTFYKSIKTAEESDYLRVGNALYDLLFRPLKKELSGKNRLVIILEGILYYIPFEALIANIPSQKDETVDFTKLEYLVKSYEISYSYSSSFYLNRLHQKNVADNNQSFVGFAPVFRDTDGNGTLLSSNASVLEKDSSALRSITVDGKKFSELKYSEDEVSSVAESFQKKGKPGMSFLHNNATEDNFKMNVGKYSCIHIATHGYINEEHPQLSMLLFSQPRSPSGREDGVLFGSEMYNLNLNADLLVLSSCESGIGKIVKGEGMIAMTRGFFYSGVRNIIFSLWKVYDKQTNQLMVEFYRHVLEGETFSSALRKSKLKLIADRSTAFPSKWSGFILVGK
jgi:Uncharacterized protein conserved in bacteria